MKAYQNNTFQDRVDQVAKAKQRLIEKLRDKPAVDPAAEETRLAASQKREAAQAEKRAARKAAELAAIAEKAASEEAEAARVAAIKPEPTAEERKAARDAKYAARKNRR